MAKGQIDETLKWIFVVIIGIFLLGFFINLVFRNVETSRDANEILIKNSLESFIDSTKISQNVENKVELSDNIKFTLNHDRINFESTDLDISNTVLFGSKEFDSNNFFLSSYPFEIPYRVNNNLFLFDMNKKYIIFHNLDDLKLRRVQNTLVPEFLNVDYVKINDQISTTQQLADLRSKIFADDEKAILFFSSSSYGNLENEIVQPIRDLILDESWSINDVNKLEFKLFTGLDFSSNDASLAKVNVHFRGYTGNSNISLNDKSLFLGALASDNYEEFLAQSSKLIDFTSRLSKIHQYRTKLILELEKPEYGFCIGSYLTIDNKLNSLIDSLEGINSNNPNLLGKYSDSDIANFLTLVGGSKSAIETENFKLRVGRNTCPQIK